MREVHANCGTEFGITIQIRLKILPIDPLPKKLSLFISIAKFLKSLCLNFFEIK